MLTSYRCFIAVNTTINTRKFTMLQVLGQALTCAVVSTRIFQLWYLHPSTYNTLLTTKPQDKITVYSYDVMIVTWNRHIIKVVWSPLQCSTTRQKNWPFNVYLLLLISCYQYRYQYQQMNPFAGLRKNTYLCRQISKNISTVISTTYYQEHQIGDYSTGYTDWLQLWCDNSYVKPKFYKGISHYFTVFNQSSKRNRIFNYFLLTLVFIWLLKHWKWMKMLSMLKLWRNK